MITTERQHRLLYAHIDMHTLWIVKLNWPSLSLSLSLFPSVLLLFPLHVLCVAMGIMGSCKCLVLLYSYPFPHPHYYDYYYHLLNSITCIFCPYLGPYLFCIIIVVHVHCYYISINTIIIIITIIIIRLVIS